MKCKDCNGTGEIAGSSDNKLIYVKNHKCHKCNGLGYMNTNEKSGTFKIGLDIHGVIDTYPEYFATLSHRVKFLEKENKSINFEVHIITGQEREHTEPVVQKHGIYYTHFFSVVDYHKEIGTKMWVDERKTWWMDEKDWLRTKGDYIQRNGIDIHFDDSQEYANWIPDDCTFILVPKTNFLKVIKLATFDIMHLTNKPE